MNLLIADMLELAKYESGTYKMDVGSFYIDIVIERVCTKLTPELSRGLRRISVGRLLFFYP
ncbi:hypothetical protein D7M11_18165 [Paenibacillus ginsengarvi]|uniref:Uncharacterized protein n=1 Tax=Paenibacillus ginsengarvi TaxID=400777 RepID=A0A3B0CFK4_9BACL|nr:hypothetical protein D7M11_18165 [Paenibacillus ginsengarvi]